MEIGGQNTPFSMQMAVLHPNWMNVMMDSDKKKMNDERARLGLGSNRNKRFPFKDKSKGIQPLNMSDQLVQIKKANSKHKRTIAGLKMVETDPQEGECVWWEI